jgi:hypothetical protein
MRSPHATRPATALGSSEPRRSDRFAGRIGTSDSKHNPADQAELHPKAKPSDRHWYSYRVTYLGEVVVRDSRDPEHSLARALQARGLHGLIQIIDGKTGMTRSIINIDVAAGWCVGSNLERYKWKPPKTSDSSPYTGESHDRLPKYRRAR